MLPPTRVDVVALVSHPSLLIYGTPLHNFRDGIGIYTSGYQTAVLGQEFDAYYIVQNQGTSSISFRALHIGIDAPDGSRI